MKVAPARERSSALTPELETAAVRRLGGLALMLAGVTGTIRAADILVGPPTVLAVWIRWCLVTIAVASCLALALAIARHRLTPRQAMLWGFAFQVQQALLA